MNQSIVVAMSVPLADSLAVQTIEAFCYEGHVDGPEFWFDVSILDVVDSLWKKHIEEEVCKSVMYLAVRGHLEQHPTEFSKIRFKEHVLEPIKISGQFDWVGIDLAAAYAAPEGWISAADRKPLESDGEVFVRFTDGRIGTAWATSWHGSCTGFAQWTHPDPDESGTVEYWMKAPPIAAPTPQSQPRMLPVTPQQVEAEFKRRNDELKARGHGIDVPNDLVDFSIGAHWGIAEFCRLNSISSKVQDSDTEVDAFLAEVRAEIIRAREKFPGDRIMTIALAEEFGELCKAILEEASANVRKEAVQTATMCARLVLDGDGSVKEWRSQQGLDQLVHSVLQSSGPGTDAYDGDRP